MKKIIFASLLIAMSGSVFAADGKAIYEKACKTCHAPATAAALKSPAVHDAAQWSPRLAKGMDALVASVTKGLNAMPPMGMCNDCSADDFKAAIEFMSK